jgi:hypothetical protein
MATSSDLMASDLLRQGDISKDTKATIQDISLQNKQLSTLSKDCKAVIKYNKTLGLDNEGKESRQGFSVFMEAGQAEILGNLATYTRNKLEKDKKKESNLKTNIDSIFSALKQQDGKLDPTVEALKSSLGTALSSSATQQHQAGEASRWVTLCPKDMQHIINYTLEQFKHILLWELQQMLIGIVGGEMGRRAAEIYFTALADTILNKSECGFRRLMLHFCWKKNMGPGIWHQTFLESEDLESNAIPSCATGTNGSHQVCFGCLEL